MLSTDLDKIGNVTQSNTTASIITNKHLIKVSQDQRGMQATELTGVSATQKDLHFYKAVVEEKGGDLYTALLVVNWSDDEIAEDAKLDLSAHGIALSAFDTCEKMDLWTEEKSTSDGGPTALPTKGLAYHGHLAYKIKCDSF